MRRELSLAVLCLIGGVLFAPQAAEAVPIRTLPGLVSVQLFETSGGNTLFNMLPNGSVITTRRADPLAFAGGNFDYTFAGTELYDFFYSDADGTFNVDGAFLTVTAVFNLTTDSALNISRARLLFNGPVFEYASFVSSFVALGTMPLPGTVSNALGDTPATTTFLGDTAGQPDNVRLSLTLGFESTRPASSIPEPGVLGLFAVGLLGLAIARRRRAG